MGYVARKLAAGRAVEDVIEGSRDWPLWTTLAWNDIKQRYRRSLLGPFWLTASMGIMIVALGTIYARIFKIDTSDFIPFLCTGLLTWNLISSVLVDAGTLFVGSESYIKQIRLPFTIHVYRFMWSRLIIFAHNFVVYVAVAIYFRIYPGATAFLALLGVAIVFINGLLVSLYLGMMAARFRDTPQILASAVQIAFFATPIMWKPEFLPGNSLIVELNPFFHAIEIVREPLLGHIPGLDHWIAIFILTIANAFVASIFFVRYRSRIPYWV